MRRTPVDEVDLNVSLAGEFIDHRPIGDIDRPLHRVERIAPIALAEGDPADFDVVLCEPGAEVAIATSHSPRRFGECYLAAAENGARVPLAER